MKRLTLTLNKSWRLCLKHWRAIIKEWRKTHTDIATLKDEWLKKNDYEDKINNDCFFCHYDAQFGFGNDCSNCPARKIDKFFNCGHNSYHWSRNPEEFYKKLRALNRKRKK